VVSVPVAIGDIVKPGDTLIVIESMKLEVALKATQPGRVAAINTAAGQSFEKDAVLVSLIAEKAA
jgi:3-methylcrotonyl-CoA carboxylase alpha subunit